MATEGRRCVLCPRSVLRQRRHILDEHLPERQPRHAEYIQQNALTEVSVHISCRHIIIPVINLYLKCLSVILSAHILRTTEPILIQFVLLIHNYRLLTITLSYRRGKQRG